MAHFDAEDSSMRSLDAVVEEIKLERVSQMERWDPGDRANPYASRSFEEWLILTYTYAHEALVAYSHHAGNQPAREKLRKAVNLGLWALQKVEEDARASELCL